METNADLSNPSTMAASVSDDTELNTLSGPNGRYAALVTNCFTDTEGNTMWNEAKTFTLDDFLETFAQGKPTRKAMLKGWIAYYGLENRFQPPNAATEHLTRMDLDRALRSPPPSGNTEEVWQSILRITGDVDGDLATALVFDVFQDDKGPFLYLLTNEHYHLKEGNAYSIQYCQDDNVFVEVDRFERDEFKVWQSSQENDYVIYKLALSSDIWEVGAGVANRKPGPSAKHPRRGKQQPTPTASVICKTPSFWFEGVHPRDEMCVYALPGSIPGRWVSQTSVTHVGRLMFYLQALSAPGGSGGAVLATKSGKMVGFIGGAYDVQEPESTNSKRLVDRRFNTYAFSVHALPRRLSSPPSSPS